MCDETNFCDRHVCVEDFCGQCQSGPIQFWADWCGDLKIVWFGGAWSDVPELQAATCPTIESLGEYLDAHDAWWFHDPSRYFACFVDGIPPNKTRSS